MEGESSTDRHWKLWGRHVFAILEKAGLRTAVSQVMRLESSSYVMLYAQKRDGS